MLIVATVPLPALQETDCVTSCMLPSLKLPVAVNCCVEPGAIDADGGLTAIDVSDTEPTVKTVFALIEPDTAVISDDPRATAVARPCVPGVLLIDATLVAEELHVAEFVRFCVLPSV